MDKLRAIFIGVHRSEEGHALPGLGALVAAVGIILLGFGAANDNDTLSIVGGFVGGLGVLAALLLDHMNVEYNIFDRLEKLEKK